MTSNGLDTNLLDYSLIGDSPPIAQVKELIEIAAASSHKNSPLNVLITGETGTGKELVAGSIHYLSERKDKPYVKINCTAIPEGLLESELFGYMRGAFTGASKEGKCGKIEDAHEGTILLDEIGDMPFYLQAKILRVVQEKEFSRIGSNDMKNVDVRIISTTNKKLEEEISAGKFRQDLYYRLDTFRIHVPPLRERPEDIPMLVEYFINKHNTYGLECEGVPENAMGLFTKYQWPGNIRELENCIIRALAIMNRKNQSGTLSEEYFPALSINSQQENSSLGLDAVAKTVKSLSPVNLAVPLKYIRHQAVSTVEKEVIGKVLIETLGNKKAAARMLGISYKALLYKIEDYCLNNKK